MPYPPHYIAKDKRVPITMTKQMLEKIDRGAENLGVSRAEFMRSAAVKLSEEVISRHQED